MLYYVSHAKPLLHLRLFHVLQLDSITTCRADFTLLVAHDSNVTELMKSAEHIALSARLLQEHQLIVGISIQPATNTTIVPPAIVLRQLGAFLCRFDTYTIPTDQPAANTKVGVKLAVTVNHILGLRDSDPSDCTLYIETANPSPIQYPVPIMVASMTNLTKLHLTIADRNCISTVDFQPLTQLSLLEDLALQVLPWKKPECCHGVVSNNRQSLQFVTLTAASWTVATYCSLQQIVQLKTLNISIVNADTAQAQALGAVTAELFKLTLHRHHFGAQSEETFQALQESQPEIHELTLRKQGCCDFCRPPLLPLLRRLTFRECSCLTGNSLPSYPQVTQLALMDCPVVTGDGLQHIIRKALPALQVISFHTSAQSKQVMHMSLRALNALHFGQNLHHIDLRGVSGLTLDRVIKFYYTMHRKQRQYKAQPCVTLLLPSQPLDKPEPVFETVPTILLPNLYQLPNPGTFELVITY